MLSLRALLLYLLLRLHGSSGCYPGIESIGTVSPLGDITKPVGSDLIINCTLHASNQHMGNSSNIRWHRNSTEVPSSLITILDQRTAQLKFAKASAEDSAYYSCYLDAGGTKMTICNNDVKFGYPPTSGVNISCLSRNWDNLTCNWFPPFNPIPTKWSFFYRLSKYRVECPRYLASRTGCFFSEDTKPQYRQAAEIYYFFLEGENALGNNRTNYRFAHYEEVLPNPPDNLVIKDVDSHRLHASWSPPQGMVWFPKHLFYNLSIRSQRDHKRKEISVGLNVNDTMLTGLHPNLNYTIEVSCRSGASESSPWSQPVVAWKKTVADVPGSAPSLTFSNFQQRKMINQREIYIYWQAVPAILENGDNVRYVVDALEDELVREINSTENGRTSVRITDLELEKTYLFRIKAENDEGQSPHVAELALGPASIMPTPPKLINVIAFPHNIYEVSWMPADSKEDNSVSENFTVFWCEPQNTRAGHCRDVDVHCLEVNGSQLSVNVTLSGSAAYEFAVATNHNQISSGMVWASCIVPYNGVAEKMKSVSVGQIGPEEMELTWRLECSEKTGIMLGFNVYYCQVDDLTVQSCFENTTEKNFVADPFAYSYIITDLEPFTTYKVSVSALTRAGEGEQSDPVVNSTAEGAPKDSCRVSVRTLTNTSATLAVLLPTKPSGQIRRLVYYVNDKKREQPFDPYLFDNETDANAPWITTIDKLASYENYTIRTIACTLGEFCSPESEPLQIRTKIGVPGSPEILEVKLFNQTHLTVVWEAPTHPNGPIIGWVIILKWDDPKTGRRSQSEIGFPDDGSRLRFVQLPTACPESFDDAGVDVMYNMTMRLQTLGRFGTSSRVIVTRPCLPRGFEVIPLWLIVGIAIGSVCLLSGLVCVILCGRRLKDKVREIQNIKVQLPKGLDSPNIQTTFSNYNDFKSGLSSYGEPDRAPHNLRNIKHTGCGSLNPTSPGQFPCNNMSDTHFTTSSMDELLYSTSKLEKLQKPVRIPSGDSSGCSIGHESVSSSHTMHTHLSLDLGTEIDSRIQEYPPPPSPDAVFAELPSQETSSAKLHLCSPLSQRQQRISPTNYTKFQHYCGQEGASKNGSLSAASDDGPPVCRKMESSGNSFDEEETDSGADDNDDDDYLLPLETECEQLSSNPSSEDVINTKDGNARFNADSNQDAIKINPMVPIPDTEKSGKDISSPLPEKILLCPLGYSKLWMRDTDATDKHLRQMDNFQIKPQGSRQAAPDLAKKIAGNLIRNNVDYGPVAKCCSQSAPHHTPSLVEDTTVSSSYSVVAARKSIDDTPALGYTCIGLPNCAIADVNDSESLHVRFSGDAELVGDNCVMADVRNEKCSVGTKNRGYIPLSSVTGGAEKSKFGLLSDEAMNISK